MSSAEELRELLNRIDHRGYPAYKDTKGVYQFPGYRLSIDHVQGDPFAAPSKVSLQIKDGTAGFPERLYDTPWKKTALADYLLRQFASQAEAFSFKAKGSGKSGLLSVSRCGQEILRRSACEIGRDGGICLRIEVGFPANGRTINARELIRIFYDFLPVCVKKTLYYRALNPERTEQVMQLAEDQHAVRSQLRERGLTAFVANGSILPRESGVSQRPMKGAVPFQSPGSMEVELDLPYTGKLKGMGIGKGVTLIVGGGYHGKSTLLEALERGVYDHIRGDGREFVITEDSAVKIRAEDGRSVRGADISLFINDLPNGKDTGSFYTEDASGSTSQAANVVEAMEAGTGLLLIDEDTSASNFMVRDRLMQSVVSRSFEPITPFIDRVRELYEEYGVSSVIVAGSSGAFFEKADCILQMDRYKPVEITAFAKERAREYAEERAEELARGRKPSFLRCPAAPARRDGERIKIKNMGLDGVQINKELIDLRYVEQLVDAEQLTALGYLLCYAQSHLFNGKRTLAETADCLLELLETEGFQKICGGSYLPAGLAMPRKQEIAACLNRYRGLKI